MRTALNKMQGLIGREEFQQNGRETTKTILDHSASVSRASSLKVTDTKYYSTYMSKTFSGNK